MSKRYDVFVSHNSSAAEVAEELATQLRAAGLAPFLAAWSLVPGDPWQEALEKGLAESATCAVLLGAYGLGPWQNEEMRAAVDQRVREEGYRVVPVLLPGGPAPGSEPLTGFFGRHHAADLRRGLGHAEGFSALLAGLCGERPAPGEEALALPPRVQAELRRLEKEIEGLEAARRIVGEEVFEASQAKIAAERHSLESGPRVRIVGARAAAAPSLTGDRHAEAIRAYYRALARECARLPLGVIDTRFATTAGEESIPLPDVYVDLDVVGAAAEPPSTDEEDALGWGLRLARGEGKGRQAVLEAVTAPEHRQAVLLGDAGSGKTTFTHYLAYLLAREDPAVPASLRGLLPVHLVLRDVGAYHVPADAGRGSASILWSALQADVTRRLGAAGEEAFQALQAHLLARGGFFLLDGLDEVPEAHRRREVLLEAVAELAEAVGERSRVLVTGRPYAYAEPRRQLRGFSTLALAPFDEEQVSRFVRRWYEAARESLHWSPEAAEERSRELSRAVEERPYLADLASRPLLLTLMATLHSSWGRLPDDRADLYGEIVLLLLGRWQRARKATGPGGKEVTEPGISQTLEVGEEKIRSRLEELAFRVHERQRTDAERREESADISEAEVLTTFKPLLESVGPETLLSYLRNRAGLLGERRPGVYAFPHRSFQEYLAASYLAGRPDAAVALRRRVAEDPAWWREVLLLAVGKARQGRLPDAVSLVQSVLSVTEKEGDLQWRLAALAGEALVDLRLIERAGEDLPDYEEMILGEVRRRMVALVEGGHLPARERLAVGDALGALGDPRPGVAVPRQAEQTLPDLKWVDVPGGLFVMGSQEGEEGAREYERPAREIDLPRFFLARYPVTNAQYGLFLAAGGYEREEYWTEEGWAWRRGAEADLTTVESELRDAWKRWLDRRPAERRDEPFFWREARWAGPNQPVVGVTWYEAQAFCRWLDGELRETDWWHAHAATLAGARVRLPTEAEWEKAARGGRGYRWPWGNEFGADQANTKEVGLGRTSAVGLFPAGRNPFGLDDLGGNVWEWTAGLFRPYPYDPGDGREALTGPEPRVVRGGSWLGEGVFSRCAFRDGDVPSSFSADIGFRCGVFPG